MARTRVALIFLLSCNILIAQSINGDLLPDNLLVGDIETVAGVGEAGFAGDGEAHPTLSSSIHAVC